MAEPITTALGSIKAAYKVAKSLMDVHDAVVIQGKVAELLGDIAAAQEGTLRSQERESALSRQVHELEQRIAQMETWDREEERYQLTELPPGVFVYTVKEEVRGNEPPHKLCANCFQQKRKSFLNSDEPISGTTRLHCPSCGFEDRIGRFRESRVERDGGSWMSS